MAEKGVAIVTGMIRVATNLSKERIPFDVIKANVDNEEEVLETKDIYKELKLRGYQYSGLFRSLHSASVSGKNGHVEWKRDWVAFMDNILQMKILALDTRGLFVPTGIRKLIIDINAHQRCLQNLTSNKQCKYSLSMRRELIRQIPLFPLLMDVIFLFQICLYKF